MKDGQQYTHNEVVNRGAGDRALSEKEISSKFLENAELVVSPIRARDLRDIVLDLENHSARELALCLNHL